MSKQEEITLPTVTEANREAARAHVADMFPFLEAHTDMGKELRATEAENCALREAYQRVLRERDEFERALTIACHNEDMEPWQCLEAARKRIAEELVESQLKAATGDPQKF